MNNKEKVIKFVKAVVEFAVIGIIYFAVKGLK